MFLVPHVQRVLFFFFLELNQDGATSDFFSTIEIINQRGPVGIWRGSLKQNRNISVCGAPELLASIHPPWAA